MAILINGHNLQKNFAGRTIFTGLSFGIDTNAHIGLIGANGAGKSSLLKIISGTMSADMGTVSRKQGLRVAYLEQDPDLTKPVSVMECLMEGAHDPNEWESIALAQEMYSKFSFLEAGIGEDTQVTSLSGGWKKKVALGRELMRQPELLLLDEPTNHLDVESILWLEEFLDEAPFATLTITHDRLFLNRISNKIWEIDRRNPNGMLVVDGDYARYCETKDQIVASQERRESVLKNTLRRETEWLRKQPRARATKSSSRIDRAGALLDQVTGLEKINKIQSVGIAFDSVDGTPKKLIDAKKISKAYGDHVLFENYDFRLDRGQRIGLLGANGAGKSTFIRVLLGQETSDTGTVERSDRLKVAYFEQNRRTLDPEATVLRTLCPQGDHVQFRGNFTHIRSYLDRFLFTAEQMESQVKKLSGGEQARLLIARLMLMEANVLVLDEPTNDLDMATLNILEERLKDFDGAIILVTHDRYFLDQVSDQLLSFQDGTIEAFSGIEQWERWHAAYKDRKSATPAGVKSVKSAATPVAEATSPKKKLSYKDQRELDEMQPTIEKTEAKLAKLNAEMASTNDAKKLTELGQQSAELQAKLETLFARWAELE